MQRIDVLVHQEVGLVFPAAQHRQAALVDQQVLFAVLFGNIPTGNRDDRANAYPMVEQSPEFAFETGDILAISTIDSVLLLGWNTTPLPLSSTLPFLALPRARTLMA